MFSTAGTWLADCIGWWQGLSPEWTFLFVLPFAIALLGWLADGRRRDASQTEP